MSNSDILAQVQADIIAAYSALPTGKRAAFNRKLKEAGLPTVVTKKVNPQDALIEEIQALPEAGRLSRICAVYADMTRAADKASFTRRLQAAKLPLPVTSKGGNPLDALIADLKAKLAAAETAPAGKAAKAVKPKAA